MQIDRSNYEIWLIDWNDGNLNDIQIEQLNSFLNENPDIKEEFDEMNAFSITAPDKSFLHKDLLKKSTTDFSGSQFEYLSIACLENDISAGQMTELKEIMDGDPEKKRAFELIQKTKLVPVSIKYKYKNRLIRRTPAQRIIRFSVIGLSAAAAVVLLIMTYFSVPKNLPDKINNTAQNIVVDNNIPETTVNNLTDKKPAENKIESPQPKSKTPVALPQKEIKVFIQYDSALLAKNDSLPVIRENHGTELLRIHVRNQIDLKEIIISNELVASNTVINVPHYDDGRSKLGKFIAKTIREKILKEYTPKDSPLRGYEIAEAGVTGLNMLFGWEMALDEKKDQNGELKSVYFSSKILKFNAPVKKTESIQ